MPVIASIVSDESNGDRTIFSYLPTETAVFDPSTLIKNVETFDIALFDGFYPMLAEPLLKTLKENGIPIVFDCGSWKPGLEKLLEFADSAICSNDFIPPGCKSKVEIFEKLANFGIQNIAITRGAEPVLYNEGEEICELPVSKILAKDTSGAGDIFHGAFCYNTPLNFYFSTTLEMIIS